METTKETNSKTAAKIAGGVIGTFAAGALTGAALGILFAPDKGSETRKKLKEGTKKITDGIKDKMKKEQNSMVEEAEEIESKVSKGVDELTNSAKPKTDFKKQY